MLPIVTSAKQPREHSLSFDNFWNGINSSFTYRKRLWDCSDWELGGATALPSYFENYNDRDVYQSDNDTKAFAIFI
jgi:hypothetical protein